MSKANSAAMLPNNSASNLPQLASPQKVYGKKVNFGTFDNTG